MSVTFSVWRGSAWPSTQATRSYRPPIVSVQVKKESAMPKNGRGSMHEPTFDSMTVPHCRRNRSGSRVTHHHSSLRAGRGRRMIRRR